MKIMPMFSLNNCGGTATPVKARIKMAAEIKNLKKGRQPMKKRKAKPEVVDGNSSDESVDKSKQLVSDNSDCECHSDECEATEVGGARS